MASPPYSLPPVLAERWAPTRWPTTVGRRALVRLSLCLPYLALAAWLDLHGVHSAEAVSLEHAAKTLGQGSGGISLGEYPPVIVAIARVLPGGPSTLAVLGALCAGGVLHSCWERLVRAEVPRWLTAVLVVAVGAVPAFWLNATEDLVGFAGLALFIMALNSLLDFLYLGRTSAGYAAGLSLALAVLCDPAALVYAASAVVATPFLAWERLHNDPGSSRSTIAVLAFPSLAVLGSWAFLEWRFAGSPWHAAALAPAALVPAAFHFPRGVMAALASAGGHVGWELLCTPVFFVSAALAARRRPVALLPLVAVPIALVGAAWLGLQAPLDVGLVLLPLTGTFAVPTRPGPLVSGVLAAGAAAGVAGSVLLTIGGDSGHLLRVIGL